jgi:hypothetical protein
MIIVYILFYQLGAGPIPYIYIAETCYDTGMSIGTSSMWFWMVFVTLVSPYMIGGSTFGPTGTFIVFSIVTFIGFVFTLVILKETKGLADEDCKRIFNKRLIVNKLI